MEIKERIQLLLSEMNRGVYEKEAEIGLSLLAALAGESILLLGKVDGGPSVEESFCRCKGI
jgi:MoxR-like ATPase